MVLSIPEKVNKLWDSWNIRGFIILSLSVQAFLILCAPLRKRRWGKWGKCLDILIWSAYLLADWIASVAIGFILSNKMKNSARSSDIQVFWAPFLLLHLGGPDTITSFALEDNEFWVRHLLGLALQFGSTLYVFMLSLPENKLWLPTLLVLIAGTIKYAERNRAFYSASFDHLGGNWVSSDWGDGIPIPAQLKNMDNQATFDFGDRSIIWSAVHHFGSIKRMLVGPFLSLNQCSDIRDTFLQEEDSNKVLRIMEIELSLLYEVLHTKLPVVDCRTGYFFRFISLVCILGALFSFWFFRKHELVLFDLLLTCVLLTGALLLDFMSGILLSYSDWMFVAHFQRMASFIDRENMVSTYISKRKRWSKVVSQLNFITYHSKDHPFGFQNVADFLHINSLLESIKGIRCLSSKSLREDQEWRFIFDEVRELNEFLIRILKDLPKTVLEAKEVWLCSRERVLKSFKLPELTQIIAGLDYTESILTWHIATELCFQGADQTSACKTEGIDYREICKRFSDYMFYLAEMQPNMMAAVSVNWKTVFEATLDQTELLVPRSSVSNEVDASRKILQLPIDATADSGGKMKMKQKNPSRSVLHYASKLASQLKMKQTDRYPWEPLSKVWVQLMCFAAINCRPNVHAQQPSKGGELLTFVWLFMNHLGLGTHFSTHY
ncbi:hypothetical protein SLE2022_058620 [Rubroshorea leprosula]